MAEQFGPHVGAGVLLHVSRAEQDVIIAAAFRVIEGELGRALLRFALQILNGRILTVVLKKVGFMAGRAKAGVLLRMANFPN